MEKIDFVVTWVDSNDPEWKKEFNAYLPKDHSMNDIRVERYRNWRGEVCPVGEQNTFCFQRTDTRLAESGCAQTALCETF